MRDFAECKSLVDHLAVEHRRVRKALLELDAWLSNQSGSAEDLDGTTTRLLGLRELVARHFAEEEEGGCLEEAVCRCPHLSPEATRLQREHPQLLGEIDQMLQLSRSRAPGVIREVLTAFTGLVRRLQEHEKSENRVLQQSFGTSGGNGNE